MLKKNTVIFIVFINVVLALIVIARRIYGEEGIVAVVIISILLMIIFRYFVYRK